LNRGRSRLIWNPEMQDLRKSTFLQTPYFLLTIAEKNNKQGYEGPCTLWERTVVAFFN
jgi:hypothetical protein